MELGLGVEHHLKIYNKFSQSHIQPEEQCFQLAASTNAASIELA
jgi:hypothetical protein